ncbi:hypothetical protein COLO4_26739 [Corchorus olitorius]|uniref:F-box domain-containing protein n=1 Tax=Corchorus olitorius TaxID=93759 RepID=A0A1R3HUI9_9ROSI|nr:hypothetical protein COLO4_26739 [Corchorus olitorius]
MAKLMKNESRIDRLSGLPDSILCHILSFLPTKYAVRSSVLSTRWRYLSTLVHNLDFQGKNSHAFINFVDRVLFLHDAAVSIQKFHLNIYPDQRNLYENVCARRICGWITYALNRLVQQLDINMWLLGPIHNPATLFTSKTLVKLKLVVDFLVLTIPTKVWFPSLKIIFLEQVQFLDNDSVRRLISGCPVLEELVIYSDWNNVQELYISNSSLKTMTIGTNGNGFDGFDSEFVVSIVVVDAPSLVYFKLSGIPVKSFSFLNPMSLVKANYSYIYNDLGNRLVDKDIATNLLRVISNVQSLYFTDDILKVFSLCDKPLLVFHNLVHLEIGFNPGFYEFDGGLAELLESAPNLRTLIFRNDFSRVIWRPPTEVPCCLLFHLKVEPEIAQIAQKLLMLPRKSTMCQVEIV